MSASTDLELLDSRYLSSIPARAEVLARSAFCPEQFRGKPDEIAVVAYGLADIGVRLSLNTLGQVYVIHNNPRYMAQLQITLAARFGCLIVPLFEESDSTRGVVKATGKDGQWHRVSVTWDDAEKAGWVARNKANYNAMPDRMLMARACTKAIDSHCPEAKLMLPPDDAAEVYVTDPAGDSDADGQEAQSATSQSDPASRSASDLERRRLKALITTLDRDGQHRLRRAWQPLARAHELPGVDNPDLTAEHVARWEKLIFQAADDDIVDAEVVDPDEPDVVEADGEDLDDEGRPF